jgi:hypothetical protein
MSLWGSRVPTIAVATAPLCFRLVSSRPI